MIRVSFASHTITPGKLMLKFIVCWHGETCSSTHYGKEIADLISTSGYSK
jgi:hypothetical protein